MALYYKYKSLKDPKYLLDILINKRIYVGKFTEMNDPMEGVFRSSTILNQKLQDEYEKAKTQHRFCALALNPYMMLMWSYYADEHKGYCLEIEIEEDSENKPKRIEYVDTITDIEKCDNVEDILCRKFTDWSHEDEYRYFVRVAASTEIAYWENVNIKRVFFGTKMSEDDFTLYKKTIQRLFPQKDIDTFVVKMDNEELAKLEHRIDTSYKLRGNSQDHTSELRTAPLVYPVLGRKRDISPYVWGVVSLTVVPLFMTWILMKFLPLSCCSGERILFGVSLSWFEILSFFITFFGFLFALLNLIPLQKRK